MKQRKERSRMGNRAAFTLIEIMVVVVIIGVLAALVARPILGRVGKAKSGVAAGKIAIIETAINLFATEYDRFPEDMDELLARPDDIDEDDWLPPTVKAKDLKDPWDRRFLYRYPGENWTFDLYTLGKDGQEGGTGENADITNWE